MQNPDNPEHVIPYYFSPCEADYRRLKEIAYERVLRAKVKLVYRKIKRNISKGEPSDWLEEPVGPVRSIYYHEIITERAPPVYPKITPPPPEEEWLQHVLAAQKHDTWFWQPHFEMMHGSDFISQGSARDYWDWLVGDLYLEELLNSLGVQWPVLENAMLQAFWDSLPIAYRQANPDKNMNTPRKWQRVWTEYLWLEKYRKSLSAVAALYEIERNATNPLLDEETLYNFKNFVERKEWAEKSTTWACDLPVEFPRFNTLAKSPFVTPVVVAVGEMLWSLIDPKSNALQPVAIIPKKKQAGIEQGNPSHKNYVPIQFWHLISDVLLHLPLLLGLPDERRFTSADIEEMGGYAVKKRYFGTGRELK